MPNSSPTTSADLPLLSQFWTASRLKVSSNFRRSRTDVCFIGLIVHCSPDSLSVNSRQPHIPVSECKAWGEELKKRPDRKEVYLEAAGGEKPDDDGEFLDKDPKDKGNKSVKYGEAMTREEVVSLVKLVVAEAIEKALPAGMRRAREKKRQQKVDDKIEVARAKARIDRGINNAK